MPTVRVQESTEGGRKTARVGIGNDSQERDTYGQEE